MDQPAFPSRPLTSALAPPLPLPFPSSISLISRKEIRNLPLQVLQGSLPTDLRGHAFFVGPGGFIDSKTYGDTGLIHPSRDGTPLFNGDPLLHRLDFLSDPQTGAVAVRLSSKIPLTPCYYTDLASLTDPNWRKYCYGNFGLARLSFRLGFRNEVNTAVFPMRFRPEEGYRLLLTWDAGRPFEIDPVSLEVATAVGFDREWKEQIPLSMPFGIVTTPAHPAFAPADAATGQGARLFTLNYGKSIGTALHPIIRGYVDAPFTQTDAQLAALIQRLMARTEAVLKVVSVILRILRVVERFSPKPLTRSGKNSTRMLLRSVRDLLRPRKGNPLALTNRSLFSRLADLIEALLKKEVEASQPPKGKSLDDTLTELLRLINVLRGLVLAADKMSDFVHLISWDGETPLQQWKVVLEDGSASASASPRILQSMHQMGVTKDYVILMDTVFKLGAEQLLTSPAPDFPELERLIRRLIDFRQSDKTVLYIVKRSDLQPHTTHVKARRVDIPRGTAHFLVNYDNPDHIITLHCVHNTGWDAAEWVRPYDQLPDSPFPGLVGMASGSTDLNVMARYHINGEDGTLLGGDHAEDPDKDLTWMLALYAQCQPDGVSPPEQIHDLFWNGWGSHIDLLPAYIQMANEPAEPRQLSVQQAVDVARHGLPGTLLHLDTHSMTIKDRYVFPAGLFGNSVQFIPRPGAAPGTADGYLMCVVNGSDDPETSEFWLFDAQDLARGPLCRLGHPDLKIGLTIHSTWVPEIHARTAPYHVSVKEDYDKKLQTIGREQDLLPLFEQYVYPHF